MREVWRRAASAGLAILVVAALAVTGAGGMARPDSRPAPAAVHADLPAGRGILFIGASYTAGLGAHPSTDGYTYLLGRELGQPVAVDAASGSGFVNPGPRHRGTFAERIARLPAGLDPTLVLLQGGRNDTFCSQRVLRAAVSHTLSLARHRFRHADLAVLGPIPATLPIRPNVRQVDSVLEQAARSQHVIFIDAIAEGWITPRDVRRFAGRVPGHPNDAGYAFIAHHVASDVAATLHLPTARVDA